MTLYKGKYLSPLGEMTMVSDGKGLTALTFQGQKYAQTGAAEESELYAQTGAADGSDLCGQTGAADEPDLYGQTGAADEPDPDRPVLGSHIRRADGAVEADAVFERTKEWLDIYFSGRDPGFTPPLSARGTVFQETVWEILKKIPYGQVTSYGEIARQIAKMRGLDRMSAQAVGGAVGRNPIAVIVPCHRVVGSDGRLTGYAGGLDKKEALLKLEKWL